MEELRGASRYVPLPPWPRPKSDDGWLIEGVAKRWWSGILEYDRLGYRCIMQSCGMLAQRQIADGLWRSHGIPNGEAMGIAGQVLDILWDRVVRKTMAEGIEKWLTGAVMGDAAAAGRR